MATVCSHIACTLNFMSIVHIAHKWAMSVAVEQLNPKICFMSVGLSRVGAIVVEVYRFVVAGKYFVLVSMQEAMVQLCGLLNISADPMGTSQGTYQ